MSKSRKPTAELESALVKTRADLLALQYIVQMIVVKSFINLREKPPAVHLNWFEETASEMLHQVVSFTPEGVPQAQLTAVRRLVHDSVEEFLDQVRQQLARLQVSLEGLISS
jgi:hypothetical protein